MPSCYSRAVCCGWFHFTVAQLALQNLDFDLLMCDAVHSAGSQLYLKNSKILKFAVPFVVLVRASLLSQGLLFVAF